MYKLVYSTDGYNSDTLTQPPKRIEMTLDTDEVTIDELCEFFGDFLKACTFEFDGQIELVEDAEYHSNIPDDLYANTPPEDYQPYEADEYNEATRGDLNTHSQMEFNFGDKI